MNATPISPTGPEAASAGQIIREALAAQERSLTWLARRAGCSTSHLHYVVSGGRVLSPRLAERVAVALGLDVTELVAIAQVSGAAS